MDEHELITLWQRFILDAPKDNQERQHCLGRLLQITIEHFASPVVSGVELTRSTSTLASLQSIANWLIHQFVILSASRNDSNNPDASVNTGKVSELDSLCWCMLECVQRLSSALVSSTPQLSSSTTATVTTSLVNDRQLSLYNGPFLQLLVPIVSGFVHSTLDNIDTDDAHHRTPLSLLASKKVNDWFIEQLGANNTNCFRREIYLDALQTHARTISSRVACPARVRAWLPRSRVAMTRTSKNSAHNKLHQHQQQLPPHNQSDDDDSEVQSFDSSDDESGPFYSTDSHVRFTQSATISVEFSSIHRLVSLMSSSSAPSAPIVTTPVIECNDDVLIANSNATSNNGLSVKKSSVTEQISDYFEHFQKQQLQLQSAPSSSSTVGDGKDGATVAKESVNARTSHQLFSMSFDILMQFIKFEATAKIFKSLHSYNIVCGSSGSSGTSGAMTVNGATSSHLHLRYGRLSWSVLREFCPLFHTAIDRCAIATEVAPSADALNTCDLLTDLLLCAAFTLTLSEEGVDSAPRSDDHRGQVSMAIGQLHELVTCLSRYIRLVCGLHHLSPAQITCVDNTLQRTLNLLIRLCNAKFSHAASSHKLMNKMMAMICEATICWFESKTLTKLHISNGESEEAPLELESRQHQLLNEMVTLVGELHLTLSSSYALQVHKRRCTRSRHFKCNMIALIIHHDIHRTAQFQDVSTRPEDNNNVATHALTSEYSEDDVCVLSHTYTTLVRLLVASIERSSTPIYDAFMERLIEQLQTLVPCCRTLMEQIVDLFDRAKSSPLHSAHSTGSEFLKAALMLLEFTARIDRTTDQLKCQCSQCTPLLCATVFPHFVHFLSHSDEHIRRIVIEHVTVLLSCVSNHLRSLLVFHVIVPLLEHPDSLSDDVLLLSLQVLHSAVVRSTFDLDTNTLNLSRLLTQISTRCCDFLVRESDVPLFWIDLVHHCLITDNSAIELVRRTWAHFDQQHSFSTSSDSGQSSVLEVLLYLSCATHQLLVLSGCIEAINCEVRPHVHRVFENVLETFLNINNSTNEAIELAIVRKCFEVLLESGNSSTDHKRMLEMVDEKLKLALVKIQEGTTNDTGRIDELVNELLQLAFNFENSHSQELIRKISSRLSIPVVTTSAQTVVSDSTSNSSNEGYEASDDTLSSNDCKQVTRVRCVVTHKFGSSEREVDVEVLRLVIQFVAGTCSTHPTHHIELLNQLQTLSQVRGRELSQLERFSEFLVDSFRSFLLSGCENPTSIKASSQSAKRAILSVIQVVCVQQFSRLELELLINLLKDNQRTIRRIIQQEAEDAAKFLRDTELILETHHSVMNALSSSTRPLSCLKFPRDPKVSLLSSGSSRRKHDSGTSDIRALFNCVKVASLALPIDAPVKMPQFSVSFWLNIELLQQGNSSIAESPLKLHILSLLFDTISVELWFDLSHCRFVYRLCKSNSQGKIQYLNEATIQSNLGLLPSSTDNWRLVVFSAYHVSDDRSGREHLRVEHYNHWTLQSKTTVTLDLPSSRLLNSHPFQPMSRCAMLLGHTTASQGDWPHHYSLGNVHLFDGHLSLIARMWLHFFGPDFVHLDTIVHDHRRNRPTASFEIPLCRSSLIRCDNVNDLIHSLNELHRRRRAQSHHLLSDWHLPNVILLYKPSSPTMYFTRINNSHTHPSQRSALGSQNPLVERSVVAEDDPSVIAVSLSSLTSSLASSGGVSLFMFLFCYNFDTLSLAIESQSQLAGNAPKRPYLEDDRRNHFSTVVADVGVKCLEILCDLYHSHFTHRMRFERDFEGLQTIVQVLRHHQLRHQHYPTRLLEVFSRFAFDCCANESVIFSLVNTNAYLDSWKIWVHNDKQSAQHFFEILFSLVREANPFHVHNLTILEECNAFERLLFMIQDSGYGCLIDSSGALPNLIAVLRCIIKWTLRSAQSSCKGNPESSEGGTQQSENCEAKLVRMMLDTALTLQPSEWTHVKQARSVFYCLFPSNYSSSVLTPSTEVVTEEALRMELENSDFSHLCTSPRSHTTTSMRSSSTSSTSTNDSVETPNLDNDWEIVTEESVLKFSSLDSGPVKFTSITSTAAFSSQNTTRSAPVGVLTAPSSFSQNVLNCLVELFELFSDLSPSIVDKMVDFLLVLTNSRSAKVRDVAMESFFTIYLRRTPPLASFSPNRTTLSTNTSGNFLRFHILANQLSNVHCTDRTFWLCARFLSASDGDGFSGPFDHHTSTNCCESLLPIIFEESLERIIPLLGLIASPSISTTIIVSALDFLSALTRSLSARNIVRLITEFGLLQALMSMLVNFNNSIHEPGSLNRQFCNLFSQLCRVLVLNESRECFECFVKLLSFVHVVELTVTTNDKSWSAIRQVRIDTLRCSLNVLLSGLFTAQSQKPSQHQQFAHIPLECSTYCLNSFSLTEQTLYEVYSSIDSSSTVSRMATPAGMSMNSTSTATNTTSFSANTAPEMRSKEVVERIKFILRESVDLLVLSAFENDSKSQRDFGRELLLNMFELTLRSESVSNERSGVALTLLSSISSTSSTTSSSFSASPHSSFLASSLDSFKSLLCTLLLHLICPFQPPEERLFAVNLYNIKTNHFKSVKSIIDRRNDSFVHLFQTFVADLSVVSGELLDSFRKSLDIQSERDERFYRKHVARWLEQRQKAKSDQFGKVVRDNERHFGHFNGVLWAAVDEWSTRINEVTLTSQHSQQISHLKTQMAGIDATLSRVNIAIQRLVNENVHETAIWHLAEHCPQHWSLSPFEAKHRVRKKLERCFLNLDSRYFHPQSSVKRSAPLFESLLNECTSTAPISQRLLFTSTVRLILFDDHVEGEILVAPKSVHFISSNKRNKSVGVQLRDLQEIVPCRYELRDTAVELYLTCGLTHLLAFDSTGIRDDFVAELTANRDELPNLIEKINLVSITPLWRSGKISNFEYLTLLNKLAGRTMNDLMQYPIFPFVLSDYTSQVLNLHAASTFRIFSRPIAVQKKEREAHYMEQYNYIAAEHERIKMQVPDSFESVVTSSPYHYGSHYSNSGIVLHYLVRLPPYTQMFLHYQDANFDIADRAFHSMDTTWRLATEDSTSGFKELVPEFFYLPEFLLNSECFNLGVRQNGERVDDVRLPAWCRHDARLFTMIGRQALESNYVTSHLHEWIDLVFGFQQSGKAALEAVNVFHPATYFEDDLSKIQDELKRRALQTMIKTFGQMPRQLFLMHHPARRLLHQESDSQSSSSSTSGVVISSSSAGSLNTPMAEVVGLRWGDYVGSLDYGKPIVNKQVDVKSQIGSIWALPTNDVFLLAPDSSLLVHYNLQRNTFLNALYIVSYSLCCWSTTHSQVWVHRKDSKERYPLGRLSQFADEICLSSTTPECENIFVAFKSGLILVLNETDTSELSTLVGHNSPVNCVRVSKNYSFVVSGDNSGTVLAWDLTHLTLTRTIMESPLTSSDSNRKYSNLSLESEETLKMSTSVCDIAISDTLGDIAVITHVFHSSQSTVQRSVLSVFTINGQAVGAVSTRNGEPYMTCVAYSNCTEGLAINVIATGFSNGSVKLWSSWDLRMYRQIRLSQIHSPVKRLCYSHNSELLFIVYGDQHSSADQMIALENPPSSATNANNNSNNNNKKRTFRLVDLTANRF